MKKSIFLPFLFIGLLALVSCKGKTDNNAVTDNGTAGSTRIEAQAGGSIHISKADFLKKIADYETHSSDWKYLGDKPAIIDFYADWCGPCRQMAPALEEIAKEYAGQIYVYKVDTDKEQDLARDFGIQALPTLWFVPMKGDPQRAVGALSKAQLKEYVEKVLLKK